MRSLLRVAVLGSVLLPASWASAADMPVKAPPPPAIFSWSGFYIGGHAGAVRGESELDSVRDVFFPGFVTMGGIPGPAPIVLVPSRFAIVGGVAGRDTNFLGGVQAGFNAQYGVWVFGVEGDISASRLGVSATQNVVDPFAIQTLTGTYTTDIDWIASLRLRAGRAFDRLLVYGTGGLAVARGSLDSSFTLTNPIPGIFFPIPFQGTTSASDKFTKVGWTVGGGFEWAFSNAWSIGAEYRHSDFGSKAVTLANTDPAAPADGLGIVPARLNMRLTLDQVTARVNYRFAPR